MNPIIKDSTFAGVGLPVFRPEGAWMKNKLREIIRRILLVNGYQEIESPAVGSLELFETSGHYPYYADSMFPVLSHVEQHGYSEDVVSKWALKPMNCPFHIGVYKDEPRSYRDLPVRYFEFGKVYRMEESGSVNGLLRSRAFEQDDGHVFCTEDQIQQEVGATIDMALAVFKEFNLKPEARLSVREVDHDKYIGSDELWEKAIKQLQAALDDSEVHDYVHQSGAAFYGPKIDFIVKDRLGREWQLGTIQLDFNLPERFDMNYKNNENGLSRPVMIHRALLGSLERFLGFLISEDNIPNSIHPKLVAFIPVSNDPELLKRAAHFSSIYFEKMISNKVFALDEPLNARIKRAKTEGYRYVAVFGLRDGYSEIVVDKQTYGVHWFADEIQGIDHER